MLFLLQLNILSEKVTLYWPILKSVLCFRQIFSVSILWSIRSDYIKVRTGPKLFLDFQALQESKIQKK